MSDLNVFLILLNCAYLIWLVAFVSKKIVWLRILTIMGNVVVLPYYLFYFEETLWNPIVWVGIYTTINLVMLFLIYLESRPVKLSDMEQKIYDKTFKSLEPRVFKHLIDLGRIEELGPGVNLVTRDTHLETLMLVVEGEAEVVLKHGDHVFIPSGGFIGEQSFITGENTSADVSTGEESTTIIRWDSEVLRNYLEKKGPLKDTVDLILSADVIHKLRNMDENHPQVKHSMDLNVK